MPTPSCPSCQGRLQRRQWWRSRKFWCVVLGMSVPLTTWPIFQLPIGHTLAMMFPPMAWGFGEWMLDFVKEVTRMLLAWKTAGMPVAGGAS